MSGAIVTTPPSPAFYVAIFGYVLATVFYLGAMNSAREWMRKAAWMTLIAAFVAHGVDIGWRGVEKVHPGTSVRESLGFLSWIVVGAYLYLSRRDTLVVLGAFIAPLSLIILAAARLSPSGEAMVGLSSLGRIHIASATVGLAIFSLATAVSVVYLLQERNLKKKKFDGLIFKSSAALETLDTLSGRLVSIGFPIFTFSMMLGGVWVAQLQQGWNRIEYPVSVITWVAFGVLIAGRRLRGLQGRRAALVTIVGFFSALVVLAIYLLRRTMVE